MLLPADHYGYLKANALTLCSEKHTAQRQHFFLAAKDLITVLSCLAKKSSRTGLTDFQKSLPRLQYLQCQLPRLSEVDWKSFRACRSVHEHIDFPRLIREGTMRAIGMLKYFKRMQMIQILL